MDTFILQLILSTVVVSLVISAILFVKRIYAKHISVQIHYKIWYFLFVPLVTFLIPWKLIRLGESIPQYIKNLLFSNQETATTGGKLGHAGVSHQPNTNLLHDFAVSVDKSTPDLFYNLFFTVWLIGMMALIGLVLYSNYQIYQLKKSATTIKDQQIHEMLETCKEIVGIKKNIRLVETPLIQSPITLGLFHPYILIPQETRQLFTVNELKYVFLHELSHQKNKDVFVNYIMWMLKIIHWFNPFVWYALEKMRNDRELACDDSVLNCLNERGYIEYGHTIIHFADKKFNHTYGQFAPGIGGTKKQIKQRIQGIANYSKESTTVKWKSKIICSILGIMVLLLAPITAVVAGTDDVYHFNEKNTVYEDLSDYFKGFNGSFVLFDSSKAQYQIYNQEMSAQRVSPDSTYKIYSALFALEENVISTTNNEKKWDGHVNPFEQWNKDHNLYTAMSNSVNWYFQDIDRELGKKQLQTYFNKINYGNKDLSGQLDSYWMESSLKISPIEQVELLHALEENKFDFHEKNIQAIEKALFIAQQNETQLFGKTGTGTVNGKDINGWFVGFVKNASDTYYFAINIQDENGHSNGSKATEIAKQILKDKQIY